MQAAPIVRVAVEAALPSELPRLVEGLRLLNRADPFLEVTLQDKGEYVLGAAGIHTPPSLRCRALNPNLYNQLLHGTSIGVPCLCSGLPNCNVEQCL